ncbi:Transposon TX1 uncharacterized protein, partial [Choanephora cucurbitarum]
MLRDATLFYTDLYSPDPIAQEAVDTLLATIPSNVGLTVTEQNQLVDPPTIDESQSLLQHAPSGKSPGLDGLPFNLYRYLASQHTLFLHLLLAILRDAFSGDPTTLNNWRSLFLINVDAKIFTKLIANRLNLVLPDLINPYQTGFLHERLISDNGWINHTLMSTLQASGSSDYLLQVLHRFGIQPVFPRCLSVLFFQTQIHISINGWMSSPVQQRHGLRQGGIDVPVVNPARRRLATPLDAPRSLTTVAPLRLLVYANDLEIFLSSPDEWPSLLSALHLYSQASNAKTNISKTTIVSLSGASSAVGSPYVPQQAL